MATHADVYPSHLCLLSFSLTASKVKITTPDPTMIEYHKEYDDPTADMVLEVKGGMKFRVHSYLLKAHRYVLF